MVVAADVFSLEPVPAYPSHVCKGITLYPVASDLYWLYVRSLYPVFWHVRQFLQPVFPLYRSCGHVGYSREVFCDCKQVSYCLVSETVMVEQCMSFVHA